MTIGLNNSRVRNKTDMQIMTGRCAKLLSVQQQLVLQTQVINQIEAMLKCHIKLTNRIPYRFYADFFIEPFSTGYSLVYLVLWCEGGLGGRAVGSLASARARSRGEEGGGGGGRKMSPASSR
jgi:hypothetical protein